MPNTHRKWRRVIQKVSYWFNQTDDASQFILSFAHAFGYPETETTFFAFTFPFSYQESIEQMDLIQTKLFNVPGIYFHRDILAYSLEGRKMEVITISSKEGMMDA